MTNMEKTIKCKGCGGPIKVEEGHIVNFCPYCGLAIERKETKHDFKRFQLKHEEEVRRRKVEEKMKEERFGWTVTVILMIIMIFYVMIIPYTHGK